MPQQPQLNDILTTLNATTWNPTDRSRAHQAADLALTIYRGHTRDQGTPYLHHPLAVVTILRDELAVTTPTTLLLGLLHDALEVSPHSGPLLSSRLGNDFTERLRAMTPDHRLEQRPKRPGDEAAWRVKHARLDPELLLIRLADRIHNLRDLRNSSSPDRRTRFLATLTEFYLPLAEASRPLTTHLHTASALLQAAHKEIQA